MRPEDIVREVEALEPGMQKAYMDAVRATVDSVTLAQVERLLEQDDEDGLVDLLTLGAMAVLVEAVRSAYLAGGRKELLVIVIPARERAELGRVEFDVTKPQATAWVDQQVQTIRSSAAAGVRDAIREVMSSRRVIGGLAPAGSAASSSQAVPAPRTIRQAAQDLLGQRDPQTGQRTGGLLGLPGNMVTYIRNARAQLESGDPAELKKYLKRIKRDRRYDRMVEKAITDGKPLTQAQIAKATNRYANRLLNHHATTLAEMLAHEAYSAGRERAWEQMVEQGLDRDRVEKEWRTRRDEKVRESHVVMNGQRVKLGGAFSGGGSLLRFPGDTSLGAGYDMVAGCRCICIYHLLPKPRS
ncbi:hypothetical protein RRX38_02830 [Pseudomonas sp. DTU_2021_1001937_2_SI_NGA_ILE_001]|uniref:hypothetical protein n=1 Tax=Pseudomonas sp. DTU_2021_1001937_2_SI_NGA_ILE_001 TaxID=3077589 RepID=UPI0028FC20D5|nr:hypothetical protein [Pseudomonas sp. DTU_2021_1001937_2_SI_NGA_ILE_001]WNW10124.1 hypothetical protein RRX38_02830 [Pseudomonas sp. DTU_2021_1001937_2_SI_NGA_ILE_001]